LAKHNKLVKEGELIAFMFLRRDGFTILETNWIFQKTEVDIISKKDGFLIFTKVKTRRSKKFGKQSDAIHKQKIAIYKYAAKDYLVQHTDKGKLEIRFDIVNITIGKDETEIKHIPNAF
tara:strand:+ start:678 stop:1034 length:357 start_codon:yes stop_codon:yes gene_type:complete